MFTVTRQLTWPDGNNLVEVVHGSIDYAGPDMLVPKYDGEGKEYGDPVDAVRAGIKIACEWKKNTNKEVLIGFGDTYGGLCNISGEPLTLTVFKEILNSANKLRHKLPKCAQCGEILGKDVYSNENTHWIGDEHKFCSEHCAEREWLNSQPEEDELL